LRNTFSNLSDKEIITLLLNKEQRGIDILYDKYGSYLFGFITQVVKRDDLAELVLQDTFLKVWNKIETFNFSKGILVTWLIRIAHNTSIDMIRSKNYKQTIRLLGLENIPLEKESAVDGVQIDLLDIKDTVAKLDMKCSVILELIYFKGYTCKEVSEELDIPLGTVKSRIRKGFKDLRKLIEL